MAQSFRGTLTAFSMLSFRKFFALPDASPPPAGGGASREEEGGGGQSGTGVVGDEGVPGRKSILPRQPWSRGMLKSGLRRPATAGARPAAGARDVLQDGEAKCLRRPATAGVRVGVCDVSRYGEAKRLRGLGCEASKELTEKEQSPHPLKRPSTAPPRNYRVRHRDVEHSQAPHLQQATMPPANSDARQPHTTSLLQQQQQDDEDDEEKFNHSRLQEQCDSHHQLQKNRQSPPPTRLRPPLAPRPGPSKPATVPTVHPLADASPQVPTQLPSPPLFYQQQERQGQGCAEASQRDCLRLRPATAPSARALKSSFQPRGPPSNERGGSLQTGGTVTGKTANGLESLDSELPSETGVPAVRPLQRCRASQNRPSTAPVERAVVMERARGGDSVRSVPRVRWRRTPDGWQVTLSPSQCPMTARWLIRPVHLSLIEVLLLLLLLACQNTCWQTKVRVSMSCARDGEYRLRVCALFGPCACEQVERKAMKPHPSPQAFAEAPFATPAENIMEDIHWQILALRGGM